MNAPRPSRLGCGTTAAARSPAGSAWGAPATQPTEAMQTMQSETAIRRTGRDSGPLRFGRGHGDHRDRRRRPC